MVNWKEELKRQSKIAAKIEERVGDGSSYISTRGGSLSYNDEEIGESMEVIVLDHVIEHAMYADRYDADNPVPPVCFAFGTDSEEMAPHDDSPDKQSEMCANCPMNEFGSSDTGAGKACKNIRRLALLPVDALADIANAEHAMIKVPVTSVKFWAKYVKKLATSLETAPVGVVTEITLVPDKRHQFHMQFKLVRELSGDEVTALLDKQADVQGALYQPYTQPDPDAAPRAKRGASKARGGASRPVVAGKGAKPPSKAAPARR